MRLGGAAAETRGDPVVSNCRRRRDARAEIVLPLPSVTRPRCNFRAASVQNVRATCTGSAGTLIFRSASIPRKEGSRVRSNACLERTRIAWNHLPPFVDTFASGTTMTTGIRLHDGPDAHHHLARPLPSMLVPLASIEADKNTRGFVRQRRDLARDCFAHQSNRLRKNKAA